MRFLRCLALAAGITATALAADSPSAPARVFPYPNKKHALANGLTVLLVPMESPGVVAYFSIVRTGSRDEVEEGKLGFAHFFEHMMFRGTKKHPSAAYYGIITKIGANTNAYTTDDLTAYHLKFAKEDLEQ